MAKGQSTVSGNSRDRLMEAAITLFAEKGVDKVSTRDIAAAAGTSEALLFKHFGKKDVLVARIFSTGYNQVGRSMLELLNAPLPEDPQDRLKGSEPSAWFEARLRQVVQCIAAIADEDPALIRFLFVVQHEQLWAIDQDIANPVDLIFNLVMEGQAIGAIPAKPLDIMASVVMGIFLQFLAFHIYGRTQRSLKEAGDEIARAILGGLRS